MARRNIPTPTLATDDIWQSVSLEERLDLVSRCHATGFMASSTAIMVMGSVAYGLDQISLLLLAIASGFFAFPLFSSNVWRNGKPSLILAYLAVRTVSRRYAYGFDLPNLEITLIFRGKIREIIDEEALIKNPTEVNHDLVKYQKVWIVLMRSGALFLSEKPGGAKLEFITPILGESSIEENPELAAYGERVCTLHGAGMAKGRKMVIASNQKAAHYVFEKQVEEIIDDALKVKESMEKLRKKS